MTEENAASHNSQSHKHKKTLLKALDGNVKNSELLEPYIKLARWLGRSEDPFLFFYQVFELGIKASFEDEEDEGPDPDNEV
jgi:hypothetical protein